MKKKREGEMGKNGCKLLYAAKAEFAMSVGVTSPFQTLGWVSAGGCLWETAGSDPEPPAGCQNLPWKSEAPAEEPAAA